MPMISKSPDPVMNEFDGFDPKAVYQMLPVGGSRTGFKITTAQAAVDVKIEPEGVARFAGPRTFTPPTATPIQDFFMQLGPNTVATFDLFGVREGRALLVVRSRSGQLIESLDISVKTKQDKTYSLCLISDMIRRSPWYPPSDATAPGPPPPPFAVVRPLMEAVKKVFIQQCNVQLTEGSPDVFEVTLNDKDLKDPIVLDAAIPPSTLTNQQLIVDAIPARAFGSNFVLIFTWDIRQKKKTDLAGLNIGSLCFIDNVSANRSFVVAHELAHGMGLDHRGGKALMNPAPLSSLLNQFEIDLLNTTGATP